MAEVSTQNNADKKRSASYPADTVQEAYSFALRVNEKFSTVAAVTREEIGHVFGVHPNTLSRQIAACVQYGLMDKIEGKYRLSVLFADIFRPESERDKKINLIRAFGKPRLYQELIEKFDGAVIPQEFVNTLIKHHGITESAAPSAAATFIKGGQEIGVINDSRVLSYNVSLSSAEKIQYAEVTTDAPQVERDANKIPAKIETFVLESEKERAGKKTVPIYLTEEKEPALFIYPNDITEDDIELVKHQIDGVLLRIKLDAKRRQKSNGIDADKKIGEESPT
jgi:hypothetical protein